MYSHGRILLLHREHVAVKLRRGERGHEVVSLRWSHSDPSVSLAVQLPPHEEVALLFEVDVTVGAHKAAGVTVFVSCFDHCPAVA